MAVKFIYLKKFNVFSRNEYGALRFKILKDKNDHWSLYKDGKPTKNIFVTPYRWGIKKLKSNSFSNLNPRKKIKKVDNSLSTLDIG